MMKALATALMGLALFCAGCSKNKAETERLQAQAEAAKAAQAKAEAELAKSKAETELAKAKADAEQPKPKSEPAGKPALVAPKLLSPTDGAKLDNFPRTTKLRWDAVPGADKYVVEIQYEDLATVNWLGLGPNKTTSATEVEFDFVGAQPGRWRAWAVDASGTEGPKSGWGTFSYTK